MKNKPEDYTMKKFVGRRIAAILRTDDTVEKAVAILPENNIGAAGVVDETGALVGILTVRDLLKRALADGKSLKNLFIGDIMTPDPVSVPVNSCIHQALDIMTTIGYRYLPIMDGETMVGMADIRDLYQAIQGLLHEKVAQKSSFIAGMFGEPYGYDPYSQSFGAVKSKG